MAYSYLDEIYCELCGKRETVNVMVVRDSGDHDRSWFDVPSGWRIADSYPPGDMGVLFICQSCVTEKQNDGSV